MHFLANGRSEGAPLSEHFRQDMQAFLHAFLLLFNSDLGLTIEFDVSDPYLSCCTEFPEIVLYFTVLYCTVLYTYHCLSPPQF